MKSKHLGQIVVALIGAFVLYTIFTSAFRSAVGGRMCQISGTASFESPNGQRTLTQKLVACSEEEVVSQLSVVLSENPGIAHTFLETAAEHTTPDGVSFDPVAFDIKWVGNNEVRIQYPPGLDIYRWFKTNEPHPPEKLEFDIEGVSIVLLPNGA